MKNHLPMFALPALFACHAAASIIVPPQTWNDNTTNGWADARSWADLSNPASGGTDNAGYLRVYFAAAAREAVAPASSCFAGNWEDKRGESDSSGWNKGGAQEQFLNDLAAIDWIGMGVRRGAGDAREYGLADSHLMVPEPGETMLLGAALASAALALRRRLTGTTPV